MVIKKADPLAKFDVDGTVYDKVVLKVVKKADPLAKFDVDGTVYDKVVLKMVLDGYTAPITSGRFLNLVEKGFYNNMMVQRSDGFVIQTGDPNFEQEDLPHGLVDDKGAVTTIPLEVFAEEDVMPTYGVTLEDDGRPLSQPKLPFSVYGTLAMARSEDNANDGSSQLAMARSEDNANDGSSQFFFLLFDPELTTAGRNLMDGRFATFGYVVDGNRLLSNVEQGDTIISAAITSGKENLVNVK
ncbi:cyclophilin type peptidyl-prolyl cis-trans isomerase/CLD-domain-containing protein [Baffinella frigidus]|nr:cyclophilin type peptidyl-prolyl cis-trans isomerase/CLD-domain-containing protein [Cryptophyta sp. CCMP2293]